jgi:hypothetical protein
MAANKHAHLLVMTPKLGIVSAADMVGMSHNSDVLMTSFEVRLGMLWGHVHSLRDFLVDDDVDFDTFACFALEYPVQAPFCVVCRWATKVELRREPPVLKQCMRWSAHSWIGE